MRRAECSIDLIFTDRKKAIRCTLDEFIQLQKGDTILLPKSLGSSSDNVEPAHSTHTKSNRIREGAYVFQGVNRIYGEPGGPKGLFEIEYFFSRVDD